MNVLLGVCIEVINCACCINKTRINQPRETVNATCSTMRGRIKGTDSTINAILATAVLYELRWKIWNGAE